MGAPTTDHSNMFTESADFYDAIYSFKDYAAEAAQIAALVRASCPHARSILDVACGTGGHARHLVLSHGFDVDGLDLDAGLLRVARDTHPSGQFFLADMSDFAGRLDRTRVVAGSIRGLTRA
jgi:ubiquinone/menaquinone biosynthesis C-methylase UbiE